MTYFKKTALILAAFSTVTSTAYAQDANKSTKIESKVVKPNDVQQKKNPLAILEFLELSKEQRKKIFELRSDYRTKIIENKRARQDALTYQKLFISSLSKDGLKEEALLKDAVANFESLEKIRLNFTAKIIKILTPEQREAFKKKLQQKLDDSKKK